MLILDGHNSHTTYRFCDFAKRHNIIVVCLPPHTTHRLQPCDVGVFGPLNSTWKAEVNAASRENIEIRKHNLIKYYSRARQKAFTPSTIQSAFRTTGIWPLDPTVIEPAAYAPALNTTTESAQPVPALVPSFVTVNPPNPFTPHPSAMSTPSTPTVSATMTSLTTSCDTTSTPTASAGSSASQPTSESETFTITVPRRLGPRAGAEALAAQNEELRYLLDQACYQMAKDYALKKLMDKENERLRKQLYTKKNKHNKKERAGFARHMTSEENLIELAKEDWVAAMKLVWKEPVWKQRREICEKHARELAAEEKKREQEAARAAKAAERLRERQRKDGEKRQKQAERKREREQQKAVRDQEKIRMRVEAAAARSAKKAAANRRSTGRTTRSQTRSADAPAAAPDDVETEVPPAIPTRPRPKPRPIRRVAAVLSTSGESGEGAEVGREPLVEGQPVEVVGGDRSAVEVNDHNQSEEYGQSGHSQPLRRSRRTGGKV